jgi:hypothetical protein
MFKKLAVGLVCVTASVQALRADSTQVNFDSGLSGVHLVADQNGTALPGGGLPDGNGAVLQLGYYSAATTANNFAGTWIPLSGQGSNNTAVVPGSTELYNQTSVGDVFANGPGNGQFAITLLFDLTNPLSSHDLPSSAVPLSIRFYNGTSIANSSFYNVVSDDVWTWKTPAIPANVVNISLDDTGLEWLSIAQGGLAGTAFRTTIPTAIPEPSTLACLLFGGAGTLALGARRRFKS